MSRALGACLLVLALSTCFVQPADLPEPFPCANDGTCPDPLLETCVYGVCVHDCSGAGDCTQPNLKCIGADAGTFYGTFCLHDCSFNQKDCPLSQSCGGHEGAFGAYFCVSP